MVITIIGISDGTAAPSRAVCAGNRCAGPSARTTSSSWGWRCKATTSPSARSLRWMVTPVVRGPGPRHGRSSARRLGVRSTSLHRAELSVLAVGGGDTATKLAAANQLVQDPLGNLLNCPGRSAAQPVSLS